VELIANRFDRADGIALADAETSLGKKFLDVLAADRRALVLALNGGIPVVMNGGKSRMARDITRLAAKVAVSARATAGTR